MDIALHACPFCGSHQLHTQRRLLSYSVCCGSCRASGPHQKDRKKAFELWNTIALQAQRGASSEPGVIQGRLTELQDAVRNLSSLIRPDRDIDAPRQRTH